MRWFRNADKVIVYQKYGAIIFIIIQTFISEFYLRIETADEYAAGTDSGVYLDIYFVHGMAAEGLWGSFERGEIDWWRLDYSLGDPYAIEIEKDGEGLFEEWKLVKVRSAFRGLPLRLSMLLAKY